MDGVGEKNLLFKEENERKRPFSLKKNDFLGKLSQ